MAEQTTREPYVLIDSEDGVEERAWVPVEMASTAGAALRVAAELSLLDHDDELRFEPDGRAWHRLTEGEWDDEYARWEECEPTDEGAREFWVLLVTDEPEAGAS